MTTLPPVRRKHNICVICEGYEDYHYFKRLIASEGPRQSSDKKGKEEYYDLQRIRLEQNADLTCLMMNFKAEMKTIKAKNLIKVD